MFVVGAFIADMVIDIKNERQQQTLKKSTELVMFSSPLCAYCAYFEQNVIPIYKHHDLAQIAPLNAVNMDEEGSGPYTLEKPIEVLPTFIVMRNGKEVGRLSGIPDKLYFLAFVRDHVM